MESNGLEQLVTTGPKARKMLDVGNTKYWALVKDGTIKMAQVGKRKMPTVASIKAAAQPIAA